MTVIAPISKLSKKVGIPLCLFWAFAGVGVWLLPFQKTGNILWDSPIIGILVKIIFTLAVLFGLFATISWMIWGDY